MSADIGERVDQPIGPLFFSVPPIPEPARADGKQRTSRAAVMTMDAVAVFCHDIPQHSR